MSTQEITKPKMALTRKMYYDLAGNKMGYLRNKARTEWQLIGIIFIDWLLLNASVLAALHRKLNLEENMELVLWPLLIINALAIPIATYTNVFRVFEGIRLPLKIRDLLWSSVFLFGTFSIVYYPFFYPKIQANFVLEALLLFVVPATGIHMMSRFLHRKNAAFLSYAVIGGNADSLRYLDQVLSSIYGTNTFCLGRFADKEIPGIMSLGGFEEISDYLKRNNNVNKVIYLSSPLHTDEVKQISRICRTQFIEFEVIPTEVGLFGRGTLLEQVSNLPVLRRRKEPLKQFKNRLLKRLFDIVFSSLVILLIFPWLIPLIGLLIRLESRGPIFFTQTRTGYWNKPFKCYKFRSMKVNKQADSQQAVKQDARITRIGKLLRKTNLDEFPQFINVFKGEMSVVGPRPHMLKHTEVYSDLIDKFMVRHEVKPGITGWAQVNGWRGPTGELFQMKKRVEFDVYYIENWSIWMDFNCIFLTVFNVFRGEENAF
jgi:Undecaprenyl-phosphate glucose phosphotransferase